MKRKLYVIPIFVPHLGCPHDCVFCNQKSISGQMKMITEDEVINTIETFLKSFKDKNAKVQIAFFGGSFTGIDIETQETLLKIAYRYIEAGKVDSIRISTRPDYIDKDILKRLKKYHVKTIELGVQSSNDYILKTAERGHTFEDVKKASRLIRWNGFKLGHQMMVGLPESKLEDEIKTAKDLIKLKPKMVRIYPVLVVKKTKLEQDYYDKEYFPLSVDQAVERCKELVYLFNKKRIDIIRIGLQNTEIISDPENKESEVVAGPYHPAFGQMVSASIWYDRIVKKIGKLNVKAKDIVIFANSSEINDIVGHKKCNIEKLKEFYHVNVKVKEDEKIKKNKFKIKVIKTYEN